jgi:hypothetical protein
MVEEFDWDPSVKSLVAFPTVLERMGQSPDWTRKLGDAFIVQEPQVMETVQALRQRAQAAGTLISDDKVRILDEPQAISIVPANPQLLYVPYYDPWVAYGTWWWPAYPPFAWDPWPGYYYGYRPYYYSAFWWGAPIGISAGFFFGAIDWPRRHVRVAHTNNYYVRRWIDRHHLSGNWTGRWRPDYWQRRDFSRRGTVTQSQTVAPTTQIQQFAAPTTQQQIPGTRTWRQPRQFSGTTTQSPQIAAPTTAAPTERRSEMRGREWRRPEVRSAPRTATAAPPAVQQAPRMERAPAARVERVAPAPRAMERAAPRAVERAAPPARVHSAAPAARADHGPRAHSNSREQRTR